MRSFILFAVGMLFGVGLYLSGMTQPGKVQGFLDIFGRWDPSLAFVMIGAIIVGRLAFSLVKLRSRTLLGEEFQLPPVGAVDRPLIVGSFIFGVGWGLSGVCPGPAIFNVGLFDIPSMIFVVSMAAGMELERRIRSFPASKPRTDPAPARSVIADA